MDIPNYVGSLYLEELTSWIVELDKYFKNDSKKGPKEVQFACT